MDPNTILLYSLLHKLFDIFRLSWRNLQLNIYNIYLDLMDNNHNLFHSDSSLHYHHHLSLSQIHFHKLYNDE